MKAKFLHFFIVHHFSSFFFFSCFHFSFFQLFLKMSFSVFFFHFSFFHVFSFFSFFHFIHFFSFFCSFLHFLIFLMFFHFFIFSKEKVSSFLFSCISFNYFLLLAFVSEFNCFLRSRCSMEMWCPNDIGRDSWDWVGPPAWGRACFNSPEWGGGSSPVGSEPPQIVFLLLLLLLPLLFVSGYRSEECMSTTCHEAIGRSPRQQRTLHRRGLRKLALNSGTTRRSAKNAQPYIAAKPSTKPTVSAHWSVHQLWRSTESEAPPARDPSDDLHNRDIVHLVRALQLRGLHSFLL